MPSERLKKIIGCVKFSEIKYQKKCFFDHLVEIVGTRCKIIKSTENIGLNYPDYSFIRIPSFVIISNIEQFQILLDKLTYINDSVRILGKEKTLLAFYKDVKDFVNDFTILLIDNYCIKDISDYTTFVRYISGGFDTRFFNNVKGDNYSIIKTSRDKYKIRKEYNFAYLLPDSMKRWIVFPYNYKEDNETASYEMERINVADVAIRWIHGAIELNEFNVILDNFFYYITTRISKKVSKKEYYLKLEELYLKKVLDRVAKFKTVSEYDKIARSIASSTKIGSIDGIIKWYTNLFEKIIAKQKFNYISVIGHGDTFFANMLYDYETNMLKFVDPKGANKEEELWTDPYYDVAKFSHSILGNYDFIVNEMFSINMTKELEVSLSIENNKREQYSKTFLQRVLNVGFDIKLIRLFEASLFISMLPLHIDSPRRVLAFILNTINILYELENV
jgi:hypothetical protein